MEGPRLMPCRSHADVIERISILEARTLLPVLLRYSSESAHDLGGLSNQSDNICEHILFNT